jgi:hypothetical protein
VSRGPSSAAADGEPSGVFVGRFKTAGLESERSDRYVRVEVTREGELFSVELAAGHPSGRGAAPDGSGAGRVGADGVLRFDYSDSFENRGAGTLRRTGDGVELEIELEQVEEPRCLVFYERQLLMRSVSDGGAAP